MIWRAVLFLLLGAQWALANLSNPNTYDANGNMAVRDSQLLRYDAENRLIEVTGTNRITLFGYDGDGVRLWKQTSGTNTLQVWIGDNYEEKDGQVLFHILAAGNMVCTFDATGTNVYEYYHSDNLHSSSVMTDQSGNRVQHYEYSAYGRDRFTESTNAFSITRRYTSQKLDEDTGLYFYGARYYDQTLGRFIQADDVIPSFFEPQSLNRYSYCYNNPLRYTDPDGHGPIDDALFNTDTIKSSYQLMTMHDTFGNKLWEVPAGGIAIIALSADAVFNVITVGEKGLVTGGIKEGVKVGFKDVAKTEGEKAGAEIIKAGEKAGTKTAEKAATTEGKTFDQARKEAFENAGMTDPSEVKFTKVDPKTGTVVEFKKEGGAEVNYDGPHTTPGAGHESPHVGWQTGGKRNIGGKQKGNIPYSGPQHPSRTRIKGEGAVDPH